MSFLEIFTIFLGICALYLIFSAGKLFFKILGLLLVIPVVLLTLYLFSIGPFKTNNLSRESIHETFCVDNKDPDVCECVALPYLSKLTETYSEEELEEIETKNYESAYIAYKVIDKIKMEIYDCTGSEDSAKVLVDRFVKGLIPMSRQAGAAQKKISETWDSFHTTSDRLKELGEKLE
jgi:hypothetical protein